MRRLFFQNILILASFLIPFNLVNSEEEFRMSSSEKAWSVFNPNDNQKCFIVSQSIKDEAFRNGEKLSSVNRDRGKLYIQKDPSSPSGFVASFSAGYPLKIGGKFILKIDVKDSKNEDIKTKLIEDLEKLNELYKSGVITEEEFKKAKEKILN